MNFNLDAYQSGHIQIFKIIVFKMHTILISMHESTHVGVSITVCFDLRFGQNEKRERNTVQNLSFTIQFFLLLGFSTFSYGDAAATNVAVCHRCHAPGLLVEEALDLALKYSVPPPPPLLPLWAPTVAPPLPPAPVAPAYALALPRWYWAISDVIVLTQVPSNNEK
jgi:hypothetical protein